MSIPKCIDKDKDCEGLNHLNCYLYDPSKGMCPYLIKPKKIKQSKLKHLTNVED